MTFNIYDAEFVPNNQDALITGTNTKVGEFFEGQPGNDGVTDYIFLDGTKANEKDLSVSLGDDADDQQVLFIDVTDYDGNTFIKLTESDDHDCVVLTNVVSIRDPHGNVFDNSNGDTNGDLFGDKTFVIDDDDDDEKFRVTYVDENGHTRHLFFESDDEVNLYVDFICFTRGTQILTPSGERAVETLEPGDLVITRDNGLQPIRWTGSKLLGPVDLAARADLRPIRIRAGALGPNQPSRDLTVSPQHRMMRSGWQVELMFGEAEVLVPAKALLNDHSVTVDYEAASAEYVHIMFDQHEIVYANGAEAESFHAGEVGLSTLTEESRSELVELFPELATPNVCQEETARTVLRRHEAGVLPAN